MSEVKKEKKNESFRVGNMKSDWPRLSILKRKFGVNGVFLKKLGFVISEVGGEREEKKIGTKEKKKRRLEGKGEVYIFLYPPPVDIFIYFKLVGSTM